MNLWTIGHSNRSIDEFIALLLQNDIQTFVDIRSDPRSKWPWFHRTRLQPLLMRAGIGYAHIPKLGGKRPRQLKVPRYINDSWQNDSFHNYADYSMLKSYEEGLTQLLDIASKRKIAYGCAEALPWQCHRLLVSNTLVARGHNVFHIMNEYKVEKHKLGVWGAPAHVDDCLCVTYPSNKPVQLRLHF